MNKPRMLMLVTALAVASTALAAGRADAIPAFARKYRVSCTLCHAPAPRLTEFGEDFAANGFELAPGEAPRDTVDTGDALLRLLARIDIAVRLDIYATASTPLRRTRPSIDLLTPYNIKVLSGGALGGGISYYMYFFLSERGEVAGLEDAYIQFTDIGGSGISLMAGQFQVSDPLFKRELRLEYEDYQPYRVRVGEVRADLTYDRGLFATYSPWQGGDLAVIVVNGTGISEAGGDRAYDVDAAKNVALRYSQKLGMLRVGGFGYFGEQRSELAADRIRVFGPDATLSIGNVEVNAQYLRRTDTNPWLNAAAEKTEVRSGFAELLWSPAGPQGRWHTAALYNRIDADAPSFTIRAGEDDYLERYQSVSASLHYLLRRNVRLLGELGYDIERERTRLTVGGFLAW